MTPSQGSFNLHSIPCDDLSDWPDKQYAFPGMLRNHCHGTFRSALQKDAMVPALQKDAMVALEPLFATQNILLLYFYTLDPR